MRGWKSFENYDGDKKFLYLADIFTVMIVYETGNFITAC
jgi:hypothetical protein